MSFQDRMTKAANSLGVTKDKAPPIKGKSSKKNPRFGKAKGKVKDTDKDGY